MKQASFGYWIWVLGYWIWVLDAIILGVWAFWNIMHWYEGIIGIAAVLCAAFGVKMYIDIKAEESRSRKK